MRTTNKNKPILANLGKTEQNRIWATLGETGKKWEKKRAKFGETRQKKGNNRQKTGERNRTLEKQGKTKSFAEF